MVTGGNKIKQLSTTVVRRLTGWVEVTLLKYLPPKLPCEKCGTWSIVRALQIPW